MNSDKRFILGDDSDSEQSDVDEEPKRRFSVSGESDCCSTEDGIIGFLVMDDDSGLGMSVEESERASNASSESGQILPLRSVNIGGMSKANEHKQHRTRRGKKYRFNDFYEMKNDHLGSGAYASVSTCVSLTTGQEFAVKLVNKHEPGHTRSRILREVDVFKMCREHPNIVQLIEWYEDDEYFYLVFEKMQGGQLLSQIQNKVCFSEQEAAQVTKDIANALKFLHSKGVAHRDLKPENVLCTSLNSVSPVKLCDLDLASKPTVPGLRRTSRQLHSVQSEPDLTSPVGSAEFLAPEVVEAFVGEALKYNRQCDLWSLGVIIYIMLCGYVPFYGECDKADSCGWNQGQPCNECQEDLFKKIREGSFEFPAEEWDKISEEAKDLITHLLVKDVRQRYTATDVLKHPWISCAPETPLHTADNLFRNNSTKDIQQYNQNFNMNHFTSRLSSRLEETIPSLGSTPENEAASSQQDLPKCSQEHAQEVVEGASKVLLRAEAKNPVEAMPNFFPAAEMPMNYYVAPPMLNMNGALIYALPMASNAPLDFAVQPPFCYPPQQQFYQQPYFFPMPPYEPPHFIPAYPDTMNAAMTTEAQGQQNRASSAARLHTPPTTGDGASTDAKKLQQHRGSLSTIISQLGLESCQNAMVRQGSSGKEIHGHQQRETQVNV